MTGGSFKRFALATSFDPLLIEGLARLNSKNSGTCFEEVFGGLRRGLVGNARHAYRLPLVDLDAVKTHIRHASRCGISYVHLLNSPDVHGDLSDTSWRREVRAWLEELAEIGIQSLTIANEALIRLVLEDFTKTFRVKLSLISGVETVERARYFEDLGVDVITLSPFSLNRDFDRLEAVRQAVSCELEVYANVSCLHACPLAAEHYRYLGATTKAGAASTPEPDPYLRYCSKRFLAEPVQLLKSPFVRPEDAHVYFSLGIDRLKLSDRAETTEFLLTTAGAYAEGSYSGNLFELVFRNGSKFRAALGPPVDGTRAVPFIIDNQALSSLGFLDRIRSLEGQALEKFYEDAAREAVSWEASGVEGWIEDFSTSEFSSANGGNRQ